MNVRLLLLAALLFILASCGAPRQGTVMIRMTVDQEKYFREVLIPPFEKKNRCKITVDTFADAATIDASLRGRPGRVILLKTPFEQTQRLYHGGLMMPVDTAAGPKKTAEIRDKYFLLQLATYDGKLYYFPRKFETRITVYLKSRVQQAVSGWGDQRDAIDSLLKAYNGYGLPSGYLLEPDPNEWDFYDVFTAGYFWAHQDSGKFTPRVAHRGKRYSGTSQRLVDRIFELGGSQADVLSMDGAAVAEAFAWEALYAREGIYNPKMWEQEWSGADVWKGFKNGEVYFAFMTQLDCFTIHGNYTPEQPGYVDNPEDLGFAVMPKGVSIGMSDMGKVLREGDHAVSTGGWWWGIPKDAPHPDLSIKLAEWILKNENQVSESTLFGMIPVRKDILGDLGLLFGRNWISDIYNVSLKQLVYNRFNTVPAVAGYSKLEQVYLDAWFDMVAKGNWGTDKAGMVRFVEDRLRSEYQPRAAEAVGKK